MNEIEKFIAEHKLITLDGAMATELEKKGMNLNDPLWSARVLAENPKAIKEVHLSYLKAGAKIIITSSYQATIEGFMKRGYSRDQAQMLMIKSMDLAKEARREYMTISGIKQGCDVKIAASIGPYGAFLADGSEYRGQYDTSLEALEAFHEERISILSKENPDLLACETIPCLIEAKAIVNVLKKYPEHRAWMSFSCRDSSHISDGEAISECAKWLDEHPQIVAIGINCTAPEYVENLIREIRKGSQKPIVVYPNHGETYDAVNKVWLNLTEHKDFMSYVEDWINAGAKIIGGCCRTSPEEIEKIALKLSQDDR